MFANFPFFDCSLAGIGSRQRLCGPCISLRLSDLLYMPMTLSYLPSSASPGWPPSCRCSSPKWRLSQLFLADSRHYLFFKHYCTCQCTVVLSFLSLSLPNSTLPVIFSTSGWMSESITEWSNALPLMLLRHSTIILCNWHSSKEGI